VATNCRASCPGSGRCGRGSARPCQPLPPRRASPAGYAPRRVPPFAPQPRSPRRSRYAGSVCRGRRRTCPSTGSTSVSPTTSRRNSPPPPTKPGVTVTGPGRTRPQSHNSDLVVHSRPADPALVDDHDPPNPQGKSDQIQPPSVRFTLRVTRQDVSCSQPSTGQDNENSALTLRRDRRRKRRAGRRGVPLRVSQRPVASGAAALSRCAGQDHRGSG
jgi:hypothetical protein